MADKDNTLTPPASASRSMTTRTPSRQAPAVRSWCRTCSCARSSGTSTASARPSSSSPTRSSSPPPRALW